MTDELQTLRATIEALNASLAERRRQLDELVALERADLRERAALAAVAGPRLLVDRVTIDGNAAERLALRRLRAGAPVERRLADWIGVTECVSPSADVREMWDRLIAAETNRADDLLRGLPSTVLHMPDAVVSLDNGSLRVTMQADPAALDVVAVPRFAYALPPRKLRNFGHWLVDCVPQVDVLAARDRDAVLLVPPFQKPFQPWGLTLAGVDQARVMEWDGRPVAARRLLLFESDGRTGGGRPLSALTGLRARLHGVAGTRRIYVTRRDARNRRKWVSNDEAIEALFRERGFEILSMAEIPFDEQARIFREARVVAGVSGAGLTELLFSPPGTHAIVLISDSLMRWYADDRGARSFWADGRRGADLAELGDSPRFYTHLAAAFEQHCHTFVAGDAMPLDRLGTFVDAALARVPA